MVTSLVAGANLALPGDTVSLQLAGPFDLSALVLGPDGRVAGDADFVFYNAPAAPGVALGRGAATVTPGRLRPGAARVVVVASPEQQGLVFGGLPAPVVDLVARSGAPFARLVPPRLGSETAVALAEIYRRDGRWRIRAIGQGYADGLAGLARDFGVDIGDPAENPGTDPAAALLAEVVVATNTERTRRGLPPLTVDARLTRAAQGHSDDMARRGFFSHENPDGAQVWDRTVAAGYAYRKVAENIAAGQRTADDVVAGWMDSPGHRRNILDADLTQIGVGLSRGGTYDTWWTQVFATPR